MDITETNAFILALGAMGFGIYLLIKGGDWTIDSAVTIAERFGIPKMIIGFTIVAFGTSLPELIVAVNANYKDAAGIALGNVIGSNIANILLVIATAALFAPIITQTKNILRDMIMLFLSTALFAYILIEIGEIPQSIGMAMIALLIAYIGWQFISSHKAKAQEKALKSDVEKSELPISGGMGKATLILLFGLIGVAAGAEVLVRGAEVAATIAGVPSALIGLTIIAIGTSLPELSTCLMAVKKGEGDIILGNIIGSNVFNILMIIGVTSALKAIPSETITPELVNLDIKVMTGVAVAFGLWMLFKGSLSKASGTIMLLGYTGYMALLYFAYMT